jgi:5-methylcytosine-specific restriction endonuclease McrA
MTPTPRSKPCTKCGSDLPLGRFTKSAAGKYGKSSWCKSCQRDYRESTKKQRKEYQVANRAKLSRQERERINRNEASYLRYRVSQSLEAARKRHAPVDEFMLTDKGRAAVKQLLTSSLKCALCSEVIGLKERELDHITPVSRGGWHSMSNLQVVCRPCNMMKNNYTVEELLLRCHRIIFTQGST